MGFFSSSKTKFPWIDLTSSEQLNQIIQESNEHPVLLFKHSTRCSISSMAKSRFESNWKLTNDVCPTYYLDLIALRPISSQISELTGIEHQSPQAIVVKDGKVIYHASHSGIDAQEIEKLIVNA